MSTAAGCRAGEIRPVILDRGEHALDQVGREKRGVGRDGRDPGAVGAMRPCPLHAGQHPGERPREAADDIADDREAKRREARRIAVGIQDQRHDLRARALDHMREDGPSAERAQAFVAAAHAPCLTTGQQHADHGPSCPRRRCRRRVPPVVLMRTEDTWRIQSQLGYAPAGCRLTRPQLPACSASRKSSSGPSA